MVAISANTDIYAINCVNPTKSRSIRNIKLKTNKICNKPILHDVT